MGNGLSASGDRKGQAAVRERYFNGKNSSATASCSGTSGKKLSRWQ
ncbi:protein of unknown function [Methylocella tundrae]|uniref:Uncharacterized protein n=1 Tax=Methylocella tundrae TaxID=227605 RepID=A0A4U8YZB8_METTU|nr:protein of unknown function [Methylocella tundrae]